MIKQIFIPVLFGLSILILLLLPQSYSRAQALCLSSQGHLLWSGTQMEGVIPMRSQYSDVLTDTGLNWLNRTKTFSIFGALKLVESSQPQVPANDLTPGGWIYFDATEKAFKCYQKDPESGIIKWVNCRGGAIGGGGLTGSVTPNRLIKWVSNTVLGDSRVEETPASVKIYDSAGKKLRLEVTDDKINLFDKAGIKRGSIYFSP